MTPRFVLWSCLSCEQSFTDKHCLCGGKYCAIDINDGKSEQNGINGREILLEDIRQKCLYNWAYNTTGTREFYWLYV